MKENIKTDAEKIKLYRFLFVIESVILSVILILIIMSLLLDSDEKKLLVQNSNESGSNSVSIYEVSSKFFFGRSEIEVTYGSTNDYVTSYKTYIYNDGKALDDSNYSISWKNNVAILTLKGEEQPDVTYVLSFTKKGGACLFAAREKF